MMSIFLLLLLSLSAFNLQSAFASADDANVYDSFANCLTKNGLLNDEISQILYSSTNATFDAVLNAYVRNLRFNTTSTKKPAIIVEPLQARGVQAAVLCTKDTGLQLKIRSGGHDYEGISYVSDSPFVILDMFNIRNITVDLPTRTAWVQTGATVGELYHSIAQKSDVLAYPAGVCMCRK